MDDDSRDDEGDNCHDCSRKATAARVRQNELRPQHGCEEIVAMARSTVLNTFKIIVPFSDR